MLQPVVGTRSAPDAFFSVFRSWSILCRPRRYCTTQTHRSLDKHSPRRFRSVQCCPRSAAYQRRQSTNSTPAATNELSGHAHGNKIRISGKSELPANISKDPLVNFDRRIVQQHPELEIPAFLDLLRVHVRKVLEGSTKIEEEGSMELKRMMRSMPHSTVLITALADEPATQASLAKEKGAHHSQFRGGLRGAVVSSMTSVTLGPPAIISFNFKEPSSTLAGIRANRVFTVHFLRANTDGANLATQFLAHPGDHDAAWLGVSAQHHTQILKQRSWDATENQTCETHAAPIIAGPGVVSHIVCELLPDKCIYNLGDHSIIVARILSGPASATNRVWKEPVTDNSPLLLYSQGQFREHGAAIEASVQPNAKPHTKIEDQEDRRGYSAPQYRLDSRAPVLYRAASNYIESVLEEFRTTDHHDHLSAKHNEITNGTDMSGRFMGALAVWRFKMQLASFRDEFASEPQNFKGELHFDDAGISATANELVRLAFEQGVDNVS